MSGTIGQSLSAQLGHRDQGVTQHCCLKILCQDLFSLHHLPGHSGKYMSVCILAPHTHTHTHTHTHKTHTHTHTQSKGTCTCRLDQLINCSTGELNVIP